MSSNGNQVPLASSQRGPGTYPRASTPHRPVECYHPPGATNASYMPTTTGASQTSAQPTLRVQPTPPQPSAPPAPQQDMAKTNMSGHTFVSQNQTQQRPQYANFQYRPTQHATRPNSHPRQQQPFIPSAATTTGPVMYPTLVFQPTPMSMQSYQQPRSGSPGYYQYMGHYIGYNSPQSHTPPYYGYTPNSSQLPTTNLQSNSAGGRTNSTTLVGPQASSATPTAPTASLPHSQPPTHLHQSMPGIRQPVQKRSHRLAIIDPVTQQDIFSDLYTNDSSYLSTETNDRHTPQPVSKNAISASESEQHSSHKTLSFAQEPTPTHSIAEEFTRMVNEAANQPSLETTMKSNFVPKNIEIPVSSTSTTQPQINSISSMSSINNNVIKSDLVDNRNPGPDTAVEPSETPVVSALSDSPVIVPKMTMNVKPTQKIESTVQSLVVEPSKNITTEKVVPMKPAPVSSPPVESVISIAPPVPVAVVAPVVTAAPAPAQAPVQAVVPTPTITMAPPLPQRIPRERAHKSEERNKMKEHSHEKEVLHSSVKQNGPVHNNIAISLVDTFQQAINLPTSQFNHHSGANITKKQLSLKHPVPTAEPAPPVHAAVAKVEPVKKLPVQEHQLTPTELLSASIEKIARDHVPETNTERKSSAFEAQAKLTQSISSVCRTQFETKMKDINLNNQTTDPDTANGNTAQVTKAEKEDINKNEKAAKNTKNINKKAAKIAAAAAAALHAAAQVASVKATAKSTNTPNASPSVTATSAASTEATSAASTEVIAAAVTAAAVTATADTATETVADEVAPKVAIAETANTEVIVNETESCENGKDETDKVVNLAQEEVTVTEMPESEPTAMPEEEPVENPAEELPASPPSPQVFVPKYKYTDDQWSPLNKSGKKCYDIGLLKQIKEDPLSKNKPNAPLLEACNVIRTAPMQEPVPFAPSLLRPMNDSLFPPFAKGGGLGGPRNPAPREVKKNIPTGGKGSVKLSPSGGSNNSHKSVIHVSLSLREDVKLKESDSAWKPTRFRKEPPSEDDQKNQELYKQFRGILNKLTPQKFDTLLDKVKTLEINNQKRLEGVIDLIFEKAIDEPNFSEAYAAMCNKLSMLKVPAENAANPEQCVNFRALIINKCQNQFEASRTDEQLIKLEKDYNECTDPAKKREYHAMLVEENRRVRMRSVGNVRFIGELYKLKMLTCKIMDYCMKYLIEKLEEEKLECLCKLLTTIGEQIENEQTSQLDNIFKKMQDIVDRKSNKISSRVKFMIQDVIELRKRKWVGKSVVDSQPKMMDQIQKEAEQQQRHIELMNAGPMGGGGGGGGGFRRDEGGRGKRGGDNRRQNAFMDNTWKTPRTTTFPVDTSKFKAVTQKNLNNIKLAPPHSAWNHGSGTKTPTAQAANNSMISISNINQYSMLENVQTDPTSLRANREMTPTYHSKGASIERSTFNSRGDFISAGGGGSRSGSVGVTRSSSGTMSQSSAPTTPPPAPEVAASAPTAGLMQEPLTDEKMKMSVKSMIDLCLINTDNDELIADVKQLFPSQYHAAVISEILIVVLEKAAKEVALVAQSLLHLVSTNTITAENFLAGLKETFEYAPDSFIDIPMLYDYLAKFVAPQIEKKHITLVQTFNLCESIIAANHGHLLLKAIINNLDESMGPTFVKSKWQESGLQLSQWMNEDQIAKWIEDNNFEFLEGGANTSDESSKILTPAETQSRLLQLMNTDESCDCIKGWVQDKLGKASNEDWFMRALIQAICDHALYGTEGRDMLHFNQDRMSKYASLINEFGESKEAREASCLFGIQHLIHRLEHPQGLTLEIFQYLHEQYLISLDGFLSWEESDKEPEGKGVMMMALTSFFTNIKEADNEDSCSED